MNPLAIVKGLVELAVSVGAGTIVSNTVKMTTPADTKIVTKIAIGIGSYAVSGLVASVASKHAVQQIEETVDQLKELKKSSPWKKD